MIKTSASLYCTLVEEEQALLCYEQPGDAYPVSVVPINQILFSYQKPPKKEQDFCVVSWAHHISFRALSAEDSARWAEALQTASLPWMKRSANSGIIPAGLTRRRRPSMVEGGGTRRNSFSTSALSDQHSVIAESHHSLPRSSHSDHLSLLGEFFFGCFDVQDTLSDPQEFEFLLDCHKNDVEILATLVDVALNPDSDDSIFGIRSQLPAGSLGSFTSQAFNGSRRVSCSDDSAPLTRSSTVHQLRKPSDAESVARLSSLAPSSLLAPTPKRHRLRRRSAAVPRSRPYDVSDPMMRQTAWRQAAIAATQRSIPINLSLSRLSPSGLPSLPSIVDSPAPSTRSLPGEKQKDQEEKEVGPVSKQSSSYRRTLAGLLFQNDQFGKLLTNPAVLETQFGMPLLWTICLRKAHDARSSDPLCQKFRMEHWIEDGWDVTCPACFAGAEDFAAKVMGSCSGVNLTVLAGNALLGLLLNTPAQFLDLTTDPALETNIFGHVVVNCGVWMALLGCLRNSPFHLRRRFLLDLYSGLIGKPINCVQFVRIPTWRIMLFDLLTDIPLRRLGDTSQLSVDDETSAIDQIYLFIMKSFARLHASQLSRTALKLGLAEDIPTPDPSSGSNNNSDSAEPDSPVVPVHRRPRHSFASVRLPRRRRNSSPRRAFQDTSVSGRVSPFIRSLERSFEYSLLLTIELTGEPWWPMPRDLLSNVLDTLSSLASKNLLDMRKDQWHDLVLLVNRVKLFVFAQPLPLGRDSRNMVLASHTGYTSETEGHARAATPIPAGAIPQPGRSQRRRQRSVIVTSVFSSAGPRTPRARSNSESRAPLALTPVHGTVRRSLLDLARRASASSKRRNSRTGSLSPDGSELLASLKTLFFGCRRGADLDRDRVLLEQCLILLRNLRVYAISLGNLDTWTTADKKRFKQSHGDKFPRAEDFLADQTDWTEFESDSVSVRDMADIRTLNREAVFLHDAITFMSLLRFRQHSFSDAELSQLVSRFHSSSGSRWDIWPETK